MNQYFKIGKLVASHGLKGDLLLVHSLGKKTSLKGIEAVFVEDGKDNFIPYFVETSTIKSDDEVYLKVEGIDTKESTRKLVSKELWISDDDFKKFAAKSSAISMLGYNLINDDGEDLGEILEVIEQPHQILCSINIDGKEALIPIHQESLKKIDKRAKKVYVVLPDGLLDIYK